MDDFIRTLRVNDTRIESIDVKGKFMHWRFTNGWELWCTYGMSGGWETTRDPKHCAFELYHRHPSNLVLEDCIPGVYFNDQRHFGTLKFVNDPTGELTRKKLASLGPDMLNDPPDAETFRRRLQARAGARTLAEALMDQSVVSGVGNYVKAEALYAARLSPHREVRDLKTVEIEVLRTSIIDVMRRAYEGGGATIATYRKPDGSTGEAQRRFLVYGSDKDPLGNPVVNETTLDGRTSWWCPTLQS
jgi:DNA-formamidopyrimidine glycosylase